MSGPAREDELYETYSGSIDWSQTKVNDLRSLADRVEDGLLIQNDQLPNGQIATLLRAKADRIEAAIRTIQSETHDDYNELVKAIQFNMSGDYGSEQVLEAWENYGEKDNE